VTAKDCMSDLHLPLDALDNRKHIEQAEMFSSMEKATNERDS